MNIASDDTERISSSSFTYRRFSRRGYLGMLRQEKVTVVIEQFSKIPIAMECARKMRHNFLLDKILSRGTELAAIRWR